MDVTLWILYIVIAVIVLALIIAAVIVSRRSRPHSIAVEPLEVSETDYNGTVLIVGAGAAGLFAGYTLEYCGMSNYQILEATNDFGGRVQENTDFLDVPIDEGAEWIHGDPKVLQDLLLFENDAASIETISYRPQTYGILTKKGKRKRRNFVRFLYREFKFLNTTWFSYLRDNVVPYVQSRIVYDAAVSVIDYSGEQVRVTTKDGRDFLADKVILTVPLAISGTIQFTPLLPEKKRQAIRNVYVPSGLKVWIEFDEKFYSDMQLTSTVTQHLFGEDDEPLYFDSVFRKPSKRHSLTYFDVGHNTHELTELEDDEILSKLLMQLDALYDGQASRHYVNHHIVNWGKKPYIGGAYSLDWDNYDWTLRELRRPVLDRLYFAGEHTEADEVSTVHGAAMSGRRAAQDILKDVR